MEIEKKPVDVVSVFFIELTAVAPASGTSNGRSSHATVLLSLKSSSSSSLLLLLLLLQFDTCPEGAKWLVTIYPAAAAAAANRSHQ